MRFKAQQEEVANMSNLPSTNQNGVTIPDTILKEPGDRMEARVTRSGRKVLTVDTSEIKYSKTVYKNGTEVETKTTRR